MPVLFCVVVVDTWLLHLLQYTFEHTAAWQRPFLSGYVWFVWQRDVGAEVQQFVDKLSGRDTHIFLVVQKIKLVCACRRCFGWVFVAGCSCCSSQATWHAGSV